MDISIITQIINKFKCFISYYFNILEKCSKTPKIHANEMFKSYSVFFSGENVTNDDL